MARTTAGRGDGAGAEGTSAVTHEDFEEALKRLRAGSLAETASL